MTLKADIECLMKEYFIQPTVAEEHVGDRAVVSTGRELAHGMDLI